MAHDQLNKMDSFEKYVTCRKPVLDEAFAREVSRLLDSVKIEDRLSLMTNLNAGKKIRGCLSCLICDALGGQLQAAVSRAIAVELIQSATLIHDDFVDQDTMRRDKPAVWTVEGARRAVLIGDVIFAGAIRMMSEVSGEDCLAVSGAVAEVSKGALHEPLDPLLLASEIESNGLHSSLYEKIIRLKTGILFGTASHMGAIAAGAGRELMHACYRYGLLIGEAYQIADDLKEAKAFISCRRAYPAQMVALAPPFVRFVPKMRGTVIDFLRGNCTQLTGDGLELFNTAVRAMEDEIEHRLTSAESEIEEHFPVNEYSEIARMAPHEIIRMFNES